MLHPIPGSDATSIDLSAVRHLTCKAGSIVVCKLKTAMFLHG